MIRLSGSRLVVRMACLLVFFLLGAALKAQGDLRFFGTATKDGKPLSGAGVTVLMDGKQIINLTTGKNGKFKFTIDIGHSYRINFSAPGCVDMYMTMDLKVPPDKAWIYPDYVTDIPFFAPNDPKIKTEVYAQKPFIKVVFDGGAGFHDDPLYRFIDEIFKDPNEELKKKQEEERIKKEAEEKVRQEELDRLKKIQDEQNNRPIDPVVTPTNSDPKKQTADPVVDPTMESDAVRLEREKQERERQEKENKGVRANYENNLLKMVAESEKKTNLEKYNKMKENAEVNSVVSALRKQAEVKGEREFLIEKDKERDRQTRANRQVRELQVRQLIETAALVERDANVAALKPVVSGGALNYTPNPHFVTTTLKGFWTDEKNIVISWPGGRRIIFTAVVYWWSTYYYIDDKEVEEKIYRESLDAYHLN
jgi:hypothetical protein